MHTSGFLPVNTKKTGKLGITNAIFESANNLFMLFIVVITLYPFINILAISLNDSGDAMRGGITIFPREFSLLSYERIFASNALLDAFMITVLRTVTGTVTSVFSCAMLAYALSKRKLAGYRFYFGYFIFSMLFSGGLVPTYLVYRQLDLIDKFTVYILPSLVNVGIVLMIIMFFREIPADMEESAKIDGANDFWIFLRIYLPLSLPCIATMALFTAVYHWNSWFDAMIYTSNRKLQVLQLILQKIITQSQATALEDAKSATQYASSVSPQTVQAAITIVTTIPIIMVYPFLQKYFVKGLIIGAVKG